MEMNVPLVLAFNMADVAKARGLEFDLDLLQLLLAVPIVSIVARREQGIEPDYIAPSVGEAVSFILNERKGVPTENV